MTIFKFGLIKKQSARYFPFIILLIFGNCTPDKEPTVHKPVQFMEDTLVQNNGPEKDTLPNHVRNQGKEYQEDFNCSEHFRVAMNQPKPATVEIIHCRYWSSHHPVWLEHEYYFELARNDTFFLDLIDYNQMVEIKHEEEIKQQQFDWFLPDSPDDYKGYYTEDDFDDFQLFIHLNSGHIFIRGSQE